MLSFNINAKSVQESNLFLRKLWCELDKIHKNGWSLQPSRKGCCIYIGRNNVGEISFDYARKGCIKNLFIDPTNEEDIEEIRLAVKRAISGKFKTYSAQIELIPEHRDILIAPVAKENISFSVASDRNLLTLNFLAYSILDAKEVLGNKRWTLQALLYEYTLQYFEINLIRFCEKEFHCEDTTPMNDYDYNWIDRSDYLSDESGNVIVPEECLLLISNWFADQIKDLDGLLYNSARVLLTAHQMRNRKKEVMIPGMTDVINSTAISSIEPLAYFMDRQAGQCDKCGNKIFSVVSKMKEILTKYYNEAFAKYYCETSYSDRSKLFHQGNTKSNYTMNSNGCYPLLDPQNPSKILMPSVTVDDTLFDYSSYVFRNMVHEYHDGSLIIKDKNGKELKLGGLKG